MKTSFGQTMNALVVTFILVPLLAGTPVLAGVLFEDHFDDGISPEWTLISGSAWIEDGWLHLHDQNPAWPRHGHIVTHDADSSWTDYTMTACVDGLPTQDPYTGAWYERAAVCFRTSDTIWTSDWPKWRGYTLQVVGAGDEANPPGLYLSHADHYTGGYMLAEVPCDVPHEPVDVTIDVLGPRIRVWLAEDEMIDVVDPDPFLYGGIGFDTLWESHARFDDVVVVPEPATLGLLSVGALALLRRRR
ncbi:MAG: PEP-CTERM sorting domain-containing protein [Phycisphaerae bacterium]|nr:PEP-CTERM sorting domain-containing protein [Phycisphaerae bacterium]